MTSSREPRATAAAYRGIRFPDRAESLADFASYKIFLEPWDFLAIELRTYYEGLALRGESRILAVHGAQGTGKTMFAGKLKADFVRGKDFGNNDQPDRNSLWHRVIGGAELDEELIREANVKSDLLLIEDEREWAKSTGDWLSHRRDRRCIVVADNAERSYFRQGLVEMDDADFVRLASDPALTKMAAQRLVARCRSDFRGALFVVLSNDEQFLLALDSAVQEQHAGLMTLTHLPVPDPRTKETVVRVNTNRLNPRSYWFCLDKAGPEEKAAVQEALLGASNFPDSFRAVDYAIRTATPTRIGRPAKKNVISLVVLTDQEETESCPLQDVGAEQRVDIKYSWLHMVTFTNDWAPYSLPNREIALLESEWQLRVIALGSPVIRSILRTEDQDHLDSCRRLFEALKIFHAPGTHDETRRKYREELQEMIDGWPTSDLDLSNFWDSGQARSQQYEAGLRTILPGYDTSSEGFLRYRPDFIVSPFRPCSVVTAMDGTQQAINSAIRRDAHVFEFTALRNFTGDGLMEEYAAPKLRNYVEITQEQ